MKQVKNQWLKLFSGWVEIKIENEHWGENKYETDHFVHLQTPSNL